MAFYWLSYRLERFRNSIQFGNLSQFPHFRVPWSQVPAKSVRARLQPHFLPTFYPPIFSPPFLRIVFLACLSEGVHVSRHYERLVPQFESRSWTGSCSALAALTHDQKMRTIALMIDRATGRPGKAARAPKANAARHLSTTTPCGREYRHKNGVPLSSSPRALP